MGAFAPLVQDELLMLIVVLNAVFAAIFFSYARASIPRGIAFIRVGWLALEVFAPKPDVRQNIAWQFAVSEGGKFFLGGVFSLVTGIVAAVGAVIFAIMALQAAS